MNSIQEKIGLEGNPEELLNTKQVSELLKITRTTLYKILESGALKHIGIAGGKGGRKTKRIKRIWLNEYINSLELEAVDSVDKNTNNGDS